MAILEHIRKSTPLKLYANGNPDRLLSNHGSGIVKQTLRVEILNFEKIDFWPKMYENPVEDQWPF